MLLSDRYTLLVPDLSGHGDSGHRDSYEPADWVQDMAAVIDAAAFGPVHAVGHSMGGKVAIWLAAQLPELVVGVVLIDCPVFEPGSRPDVVQRPWRRKRIYPSAEQAAARFELQPRGWVAAEADLIARVARRSVGPVDGGWMWKTDGQSRGRFTDATVAERLAQLRCPVGAAFALQSPLVPPDMIDTVARWVGALPVFGVDASGHHVPLDTPHACADAIVLLVESNTDRPATTRR